MTMESACRHEMSGQSTLTIQTWHGLPQSAGWRWTCSECNFRLEVELGRRESPWHLSVLMQRLSESLESREPPAVLPSNFWETGNSSLSKAPIQAAAVTAGKKERQGSSLKSPASGLQSSWTGLNESSDQPLPMPPLGRLGPTGTRVLSLDELRVQELEQEAGMKPKMLQDWAQQRCENLGVRWHPTRLRDGLSDAAGREADGTP